MYTRYSDAIIVPKMLLTVVGGRYHIGISYDIVEITNLTSTHRLNGFT